MVGKPLPLHTVPRAPHSPRRKPPPGGNETGAGFTEAERALLLEGKGIGPTVLRRIEEAGITRLDALAEWSAGTLCDLISRTLAAPCWRNSPQARQAIETAIGIAREASRPPPPSSGS